MSPAEVALQWRIFDNALAAAAVGTGEAGVEGEGGVDGEGGRGVVGKGRKSGKVFQYAVGSSIERVIQEMDRHVLD